MMRRGWSHYVDRLRDDLWQNHKQIHIVDFEFYNMTIFNRNGKSSEVFVFEAFIDMLLHISLHKNGWGEHSYVALCGAGAGHLSVQPLQPGRDQIQNCGGGQYGTARFVADMEIKKTYSHVPYEPKLWRQGKNLPETQGIVVGGKFSHSGVTALIDPGDIHLLMIGVAGVGKTANFRYPCIEYACASGMSFLCTDTKGDLFRNYAGIAEKYATAMARLEK